MHWCHSTHTRRNLPFLAQERAAAGVTLTTPPEEVTAAATVIQLQPFINATLLAAACEEPTSQAQQAGGAAG